MHHPLYGDLRYQQADREWTSMVVLRRFATFGQSSDDSEEEQRREGLLPLLIHDRTGMGPTHEQETAYRFLRDHESQVFRQALGALFESYKEYTTSPFSAVWDWIGRRLGVQLIESADGLAVAAHFTCLEITDEFRDGCAYLLLDVVCDWEPEHGMLIVCHKDRKATWTTPDALELDPDVPG